MLQKLRILLGGKHFAFALLLVTALWFFLLLWSGIPGTFQHAIIDVSQRSLAPLLTSDQRLAIVEIDTETLQAVPHRWPWPRREIARLLDLIASGSPRAVLIDVVFQQPDQDDDLLEDSIRKAANVGLVSLVEDTTSAEGRARQRYHSLKRFRSAARFDGFVWAVVDDDGRIRSFVARDELLGLDSCVLQVANSFASQPLSMTLDPDETARRLLLYGRRNGQIPRISAKKLLNREASASMFEGRIVLLGMTAEILHDYHQTALGLTSGVDILGASLDVLLQNRLIRRCAGRFWNAGMAVAGLAGALLVLGFSTRKQTWWSIGILLVGASFGHIGTMAAGFLLPFAPFILSWVFVTFAWTAGSLFVEFMDWQILHAESEASSKIQATFFPREPWESPAGYRCWGMCFPCSDVGGDYFDFFPQEGGNLAFLIADVTGHGFSAAMVGSMAKTMAIHLDKQQTFTPSQWLDATNGVLWHQFHRSHLMTSICGRLNVADHALELAWCGHLPAYIINPNGTLREYGKASFPLGTRPKAKIQIVNCTLEPGEHLILYTDGITEAVDWNDDQFGFERFKKTLVQHAGQPVQVFVERVLGDIRSHLKGRPFTDDVTLVVLSRSSEPVSPPPSAAPITPSVSPTESPHPVEISGSNSPGAPV